MGLYDDPLPPRPPPRRRRSSDDPSIDNDDDDDNDLEEATEASQRLFIFTPSGKEVHNLLPSLGRRLDRGIECYYEISDRLVQNLMDKTSCHPQDACWALEACKGDLTEAWTRISVARRMQLNQSRKENGVNIDILELEMEEEFQEQKERRKEEQKRKDVDDFFRGGTKDDPWLPRPNPKPVDDEPWFTG